MLKRFLIFVLAAAGLLAVAVIGNTLRQSSRQIFVASLPPLEVDAEAAARRLSAAIRLRTLSSVGDARLNANEFLALHEHLRAAYPKVHATLKRELINGLSLLYTWPGPRSGSQAHPASGAPGRRSHRARHRGGLDGAAVFRRRERGLYLAIRSAFCHWSVVSRWTFLLSSLYADAMNPVVGLE